LKAEQNKYSLVVSDFSRRNDDKPGYGLLDEMKKNDIRLPYIFYVGRRDEAEVTRAKELGAQARVTQPIPLYEEIFKAVNPKTERVGRLKLVFQELLGCPDESSSARLSLFGI